MKILISEIDKKRIGQKSKIILIMMLISLLTFLISCKSTSIKNNNNDVATINKVEHPRLIISNQNLVDLTLKSKTSHKNLFDLTIQLADSFLDEKPPKLNDAANIYRRIGETMPSLGVAYLITKDTKYLNGAEKWIRILLNVPEWSGSQNLGRSAWVTGIAQLYDWLYYDLPDDLKEQIIIRLKKEAEITKETAASHRALSNHLLIETAAIGMLGLILPLEDPDRDYFLDQANKWAKYIIHNAPLDGSWGEGVQYWQYGLGYFLRFLEGARTSGYHDYFPQYNWLKKTGRFPLHFSTPDNLTRVINFGDCGSDRYIPANLLYLPASKYNDGVVQDYGIKVQSTTPHKFSWFDFLTYDEKIKPIDFQSVEKTFFHFEDHGFVTMRSGWENDATLVGFRCGPAPGHANQAKAERLENRGYGPGHQHPDINNFVIYANGTWLAIDPGYIMPKETRNHNTILVNGVGQAGAGDAWLDYMAFEARIPAPKITFAETNPSYDFVIGDAGNIYVDEAKLDYFERQLMFIKPYIIIIADRIQTKENSNIDWLLQANEITEIKNNDLYYEIVKKEASLSIHPLSPQNLKFTLDERLVQGSDVYGLPNNGRRNATLKTIKLKTNGTRINFLTVLIVNKPNEVAATVSFVDNQINITKNGKKTMIAYSPEKGAAEKVLDLISTE